jgi:hypothetical protein
MSTRFRRWLAVLAIWGLVPAAVLATHSPVSSAADEQVIALRAGPLPVEAWLSVERTMRNLDEDPSGRADFLEEHLNRLIELGEASDQTSALAYLQSHELYWTLVDLDGDGVDEMIVYIDIVAYCGSVGCGTIELHHIADGWEVRDGITMQNPNDLCYRKDGPGGRPLFRTSREAFWWSGTRFEGVCYAYCSHWWDRDAIDPGELAAMTSEERTLRDSIRQEPWCAAGQEN